MNIDEKTGKVTYDNPEEVKAFGKQLAEAMVKKLNEEAVKDEESVD